MLMGLAELTTMAFQGADLSLIELGLTARVMDNPEDAEALMDLSTLSLLLGKRFEHEVFQRQALALQRLFRQSTRRTPQGAHILCVMITGDFSANTPIEFLLKDFDVTLDKLFLLPGEELPSVVPEHDILFVGISESEDTIAMLSGLDCSLENWPKPVLNRPLPIQKLIRDEAYAVLKRAEGCFIPLNKRIDRTDFERIAGHGALLREALGADFPIIARPVDSHAGKGLEKLDDQGAALAYLAAQAETAFFISPFVDYRSGDGLFRKYRIALVDGVAFPVHMAISKHWMVHYLNADMMENAANRAEEAQFMLFFDKSFAPRHQTAFDSMNRLLGLDYVLMDCAEMPDGRLLIFEVGNAMIVHAMDPVSLFPYKAPTVRRLFEAFHAMIREHAHKASLSLVGG